MKTKDQVVLLQSVLKSTSEYAIFAIDLNYQILIWNEGAKILYGYSDHEIITCHSSILHAPDDIASGKVTGIFDAVSRNGIWSGELKGIKKNKTQFNSLVNVSLCKNLKGKVIGYMLIVRDLSELQNVLHIMSQLKESKQILQHKNNELKEKVQEIKQANRFKNEFVANMSHELRTPLNGIIGFSQMLLKEKVGMLTHKQKEYIDIIHSSAHQLLFLINDLLDLAKISSGKMEFNPEKINLMEFVEEIKEFFNNDLIKKNLSFSIKADTSLNEVIADVVKLKQMVNNYISNAIKFTADGGSINVIFRKDGAENFCFEVHDTGLGIHKNDLKRLFTEFQQLSTGKGKKFTGTGLGLALTRQMAELHGGEVGVKSVYGKGSVFYAILPCVARQVTGIQNKEKLKIHKPRVLVIEEQSEQRRILLESLSDAGFQSSCLDTINAIVRTPQLLKVDVIILDFFLSDIHDWRVLKALHLEKYHDKHFPVLLLVIAHDVGNFGFRIQDFLIKPIVPENLIAALIKAGSDPHQNKKILILDDDKNLKMLNHALSKFGYKVVCKISKKSALGVLKKENISVIIVNIMMSGIEGLDFLMQCQSLSESKNIPIIIWRAEHIDNAELNHLKSMFQQFVLKHENVSKSLLSQFEDKFPLLTAE